MTTSNNPYTRLMSQAKAHALAHGALLPALSPEDVSLLKTESIVNVGEIHALGLTIVPWTTNDPTRMRRLIALGVDGLISDRPDVLRGVVAETGVTGFDAQGHRGARGLRPENTLPAFEAGLDQLVTTLETDTGVTRDLHSILWHDQFLNPESCRRLDGTPYRDADAVFHRDQTLAEMQRTFVCDRLHPRFPEQRNDLALSPVAVAFAAEEKLPGPYTPISVDQLFRLTAFYVEFYSSGAGTSHPQANARATNARRVRFNLETKILPFPEGGALKPLAGQEPTTNHTVDPQTFVTTLCGAIQRAGMELRCDVQSFDFRTLRLVEEQFPRIATIYLTEDAATLTTDFVPAALRQS